MMCTGLVACMADRSTVLGFSAFCVGACMQSGGKETGYDRPCQACQPSTQLCQYSPRRFGGGGWGEGRGGRGGVMVRVGVSAEAIVDLDLATLRASDWWCCLGVAPVVVLA